MQVCPAVSQYGGARDEQGCQVHKSYFDLCLCKWGSTIVRWLVASQQQHPAFESTG